MGFDVNGLLFREGNPWIWLRDLLSNASPTAMATLWCVWRARNAVCLEDIHLPIQLLSSNIVVMASDISKAFAAPLASPPRKPRLVKWLPRLAD